MSTVLTALAVLACVYAVVGAYAWFTNRAIAPELDAEADHLVRSRDDPSFVRPPRPRATRNETILYFGFLVFGYLAILIGLWLHSRDGAVGDFGGALAIGGFAALAVRIVVAVRIRRRLRRASHDVGA